MSLTGRTALVTGAAQGLGAAIARSLANDGARVVLADVDEDAGQHLADELNGAGAEVQFKRTDVREEADIAAAVQVASDRWGGLDILVNNAGIASARSDEVLTLEVDLWDSIIDINMRSVFLGFKHALPSMIERKRGAIVSVASIGALSGFAGGLAYGASKAGIVKMTVVVAARYARHGIRVNAIAPGMMITPLSERSTGNLNEAERDNLFASLQPLARPGRAQDIADAAHYLVSNRSGFITGQTLVVDGGLVMAGWGGRLTSFADENADD